MPSRRATSEMRRTPLLDEESVFREAVRGESGVMSMNHVKQLELGSVCIRSILLVGLLGVALAFLAPGGSAQSTGGRVRGTVSDASGGIVAGVTVTLTDTATNVSRE